ncbi:MAG TPA: hypothetical protein HPP56_00475 [Nitrospirae bacterium]|nr:hypothetical protein [Nitrospirota bacterium]
MPFAKVSQDFFYKVLYKIFHQPFLLCLVDFIKFSALSLILGPWRIIRILLRNCSCGHSKFWQYNILN